MSLLVATFIPLSFDAAEDAAEDNDDADADDDDGCPDTAAEEVGEDAGPDDVRAAAAFMASLPTPHGIFSPIRFNPRASAP